MWKDFKKTENSRSLASGYRQMLFDLIVYAYILLFLYTAFSKLIIYNSFLKTLSELPIIGHAYHLIAPTLISLEIVMGVLMIFPKTRRIGLVLSISLMIIFTSYLIFQIMADSKLPCSCGGVVSGMTWSQHIIFNLAYITGGIVGLFQFKDLKMKISTRGNR